MKLKTTDKEILETLFEMKGGYVLNFSDRTMSDFFSTEFQINIYDEKYDFDFPSKSKANRLRGIWKAEDNQLIGNIILGLIEYKETTQLLSEEEITDKSKEFLKRAKEIAENLIKPKVKEPARRVSNLYSHIKTTDDLLKNKELFDKTKRIFGDLKPNTTYAKTTNEKNDDLIQLLIDLDIVEYDWKQIDLQKHRDIGNRLIEFKFNSNDFIPLLERVNGSNSRVKKEALKLISKDIVSRYSDDEIIELFKDVRYRSVTTAETMFPIEENFTGISWNNVFYVLAFYSSAQDHENLFYFLKVLEKVLHPLAFNGDEEKARETEQKYNQYLKYDDIQIVNNVAYIGPTRQEYEEEGWREWVNSNGEEVEPKVTVTYSNKVAELWVLWSQVSFLAVTRKDYPSLEVSRIDEIYFKLIDKVETIINGGKIGNLCEKYERPFTSFSTAEIEIRSKGYDSVAEPIGKFLMEITALNPPTQFIVQKQEELNELITKVISLRENDTSDVFYADNLNYEQSIFFLKLFLNQFFAILDVFIEGFFTMTDERLNEKYILIKDKLLEMLSLNELKSFKSEIPDYLPEHLFEMLDGIEIWWNEGGTKAALLKIVGDVDMTWVRLGKPQFKIPNDLNELFNDIDTVISEHKQNKELKWKRMKLNVDEELKVNSSTENKTQKHEHTHLHKFENSLQEKDITVVNKTEKYDDLRYITKKGDDFYYHKKFLNLGIDTDYYQVFNSLFSKLPDGGEISYVELGKEIKSKIAKVKNMSIDEIRLFIQNNLTNTKSGFMRKANINKTENNGKALIRVKRGQGIIFNNKP